MLYLVFLHDVLHYTYINFSHLSLTMYNVCLSSSAKCIDHYTKLRVENAELPEDEEKKTTDPRLEGIVNKMFQRCLDDHKYKQAIGIALETRRLDVFEKTILESVQLKLFLKQRCSWFLIFLHCAALINHCVLDLYYIIVKFLIFFISAFPHVLLPLHHSEWCFCL